MISTDDGAGGLPLGVVGLVHLVLPRAGSGGVLSMTRILESELQDSEHHIYPNSAAPVLGGRLSMGSRHVALRHPCPCGFLTQQA